jgi:hypothetical protein
MADATKPATDVTKPAAVVDPKDYIGGKEKETKDVKVYGTNKLTVETRFARVNKDYVLTPMQDKLAKSLRLDKYLENKDIQIPNKAEWLSDILYEIVVLNCRTDPSIMLKSKCPNFGAYLRDLSFRLFKTKKLPILPDEVKIIGDFQPTLPKGSSDSSSGSASPSGSAPSGPTPTAPPALPLPYGNITLIIKIPMSALKRGIHEDVGDLHSISNQLQAIFQRLETMYDGYDEETKTLFRMQLKLKHDLRQRIAQLAAM